MCSQKAGYVSANPQDSDSSEGRRGEGSRLARKVGRTGGTAARGIFEYASGQRSWEDELKRRFHV